MFRQISSSRSPDYWTYSALCNGTLQAVLKMLNEIGSVENIPDFLEGVKNRSVFLEAYTTD